MIKAKVSAPETVEPQNWWDSPQFVHPMEYSDFEKAFTNFVLMNSDDYSIVRWRDNGYRFVRNLMSRDLEKAFDAYQEAKNVKV